MIDTNNNKKNIVGERVRMLRRQKGLTQSQLAGKLELQGILLDRMGINRIEAGNRHVNDYELMGLSKALEVSLDTLVYGRGENTL